PSHEAGAPAPFPAFETLDDQAADDDYASAGRAVAEATPVDRLIADMTADWDAPAEPLDTGPVFGSPSDPLPTPASEPFGGADVTEALAATTPSAFTAQV
ncbi:MAG: hypothetical protein ACT6RD_09050, partial [Brevundimonas sp.]|uniref:hypothetical protein n=1 Tax=Brevundimonas sp. TaxID=1871086 RepID=UPI0040347C13